MGKIIAFIYGVIAYIIGIAASFYTIGFVGNFIVPKSIDAEVEGSFFQALLINTLLLSIFALQHSVMARPSFKEWITGLISPAIERSTYVLLSGLALLLLFWQWQPMNAIIWEVENDMAASILIGLFILGWVIAFSATFMINHFELFGLKQIFNNLTNKKPQHTPFQINYLYKLIRHPLMLGFLIAFWATPKMTAGHLLFAIITTAYIFVSVKYLEEKDLRAAIGKEYEAYQQKVPMIIPFTRKGK